MRATHRSSSPWLDHPEFRAFAAAVRTNPADNTPRLAAADWLDDQGDPASRAYAEFIRESIRRPGRLSQRAADLLDENLRAWLRPLYLTPRNVRVEGAVREQASVVLRLQYRPNTNWEMRPAPVRLKWVRGFVERVEFTRQPGGCVAEVRFFRLAGRLAAACPAAQMAPARDDNESWLQPERHYEPLGEGENPLACTWRLRSHCGRVLPSLVAPGGVVPMEFPDRESARRQVQGLLVPLMTEFAHQAAASWPARLVGGLRDAIPGQWRPWLADED